MRKSIHRPNVPAGRNFNLLKFFIISLLASFSWCSAVFALEPNEIMIIANSDANDSVAIARYYCARRGVPTGNILALPLGKELGDTTSRTDYDKLLAGPIREKLTGLEFAGKIRCLLTIYGVPIKVGERGPLKGQEDNLNQLEESARQEKAELERLNLNSRPDSTEQKKKITLELARLQSDIDRIVGRETNASVDSELSMVLFNDYELYRWQPNNLQDQSGFWDFRTLMVCRLDGPGANIAIGLIDKSMAAEKNGLKGIVYIDSRGIVDDRKPYSFSHFDRSLRDLAVLAKRRTDLAVKLEQTEKLFGPGECPRTAVYCGWYSLKKYIDAFDFVDGAIGYHIASLEAVDLRDPNSSQWCPAMLKHGVTATLGAVAEPYLHSFPEPREFFLKLFEGRCLVEAYYQTSPFNSWQMVLVGDPLYRPFKKN
ncbi:TIGR03790 family protein [bacterium]|nr:MAG: TIGR03790 family protein [bacterium]